MKKIVIGTFLLILFIVGCIKLYDYFEAQKIRDAEIVEILERNSAGMKRQSRKIKKEREGMLRRRVEKCRYVNSKLHCYRTVERF